MTEWQASAAANDSDALHARFEFRDIAPGEAEAEAEIEQICFPPNEACSRADMMARAAKAPETFLVAVDRRTGGVAGFINGVATDESRFRDAFFTDIGLHRTDGQTIMILGLDVLPDYRRQGLGRALVGEYRRRARQAGRRALVLTCLDRLVGMYAKMGFRDLGMANSTWGGEQWHEMIMELEP